MLPSLLLAALAPAGPIPPDTLPAPKGPPPQALYARADAAGNVAVSGYTTQTVTVNRTVVTVVNGKQEVRVEPVEMQRNVTVQTPLSNLAGTFATVGGEKLTAEDASRRAKDGAVLLVSADGKPVDPAWLRGVSPDTIVVTADALKNLRVMNNHARTPAPRFALLAPAADGKVRVGANRPIDEVPFDAFDLTGKLVPRAAALARLKGGGLVLVAGDDRLPDAAYLKAFKGDLLVLASPELVPPTAGLTVPPVVQRAAVQVAAPAVLAAPLRQQLNVKPVEKP